VLYEQPHQPLRVEDEFVPAGLLVPEGQGRLAERAPQAVCMWGGLPASQVAPHLMMVCMPRTCGVLLRTLSVRGRGWHW
jgi:hypothetical protein